MVGGADDEDFIREMTGGGGKERKSSYGFDPRTAEKIYTDYRHHKQHKKRKKSFLDELFD